MMARYPRLSHTASLLVAAVVSTLTFAVAAHAVQAIATPNAATVSYSLAGGASTGAITPVANVPVFVMGSQITEGNVGSSDMTVVNSVGKDNKLAWNGLESNGGGFATGLSSLPGAHIIFIDFDHLVSLEVNNATSFKVHNAAGFAQRGVVTLIW